MKRFCTIPFVIWLFAAGLAAQDKPVPSKLEVKPEDSETIVKFIEVKYLKDDRLNRALNILHQLEPDVGVIFDPILKTLALKGRSTQVAKAEQLLRRFDINVGETGPTLRQIALTLYLVEASEAAGAGQPIAPDLKRATEQLTTAFAYRNFSLIDTVLLLQSKPDSGYSADGALAMGDTAAATYHASYSNAWYNEEQKTVTVKNFKYTLKIPGLGGLVNSVMTDLMIKEGQKLVLGKLTKHRSQAALFLIVAARLE